MKTRIPISKKLMKQVLKELQPELDAQYMAGQCAQRDIDMLALHLACGFGAKRLAVFNEMSNKLVDESNEWYHSDPVDGFKIANARIRRELEKIPGVVIGDPPIK
jgi:hypothetical protein